jgi:Protein of unknown function (DUF3352)
MSAMERRARGLLVAVLCGLTLALQGCGGDGDGGTQLSGAEMVPAEVPLYVSIDTNLQSEQWQAAQDLLDKFPGKERLLDELRRELASEDVNFERDVRPVLGPEIGVAWLDIEDDDTFVGLMQPKDEAKLIDLLEKGDDPLVHTEVEGWTVFAETRSVLDRFRQQREGDKLSGSDAYEEAVSSLPEDALLKLYFGGPQVQAAIREGLTGEGVPPGLADRFEDLRSAALALTAEPTGVRLEADLVTSTGFELDTYEPQLPEALPAGALLYVSFANLDEPTREILETVEDFIPNFDEQRRQAEQAFGFSIEEDLLPLLEQEGAFAIYRADPLPAFVLALSDEEGRATHLLDRVGALLELGDEGSTRQHRVQGVTVKELVLPDEDFSIFYAAIDGVFVASNRAESVVAVDGDREKLADDPLYQDAQERLAAEGDTIAFAYANLHDGLPFAFDFAEKQGETVPRQAPENTEPLQSFLLSATQDGNRFELSGFLAIE